MMQRNAIRTVCINNYTNCEVRVPTFAAFKYSLLFFRKDMRYANKSRETEEILNNNNNDESACSESKNGEKSILW